MKIFKLILVGAVGFSGYIGYQNFGIDLYDMTAIVAPAEEKTATRKSKVNRSRPDAMEEAKERVSKPKTEQVVPEEVDYVDIGIKILETIGPLLIPVVARRKRNTLDDRLGKLAEDIGMSKAMVRGRLGLGDRRKAQTGTKRKRRAND